ncbi:hypothetical protein SAY86_007769 [Trapa natans]|uniref:Uncharacterized protein n=1 Tax=Trapa natans TaxID=22666 RepID=A0AAN7R0K3_TRANT|nr:hypothetical protein SAY86_007769 [Trapa natans]
MKMAMAVLHCPLYPSPLSIPSFVSLPPRPRALIFPSPPHRNTRDYLTLRCSNSPPTTEQELLDAIAKSDGEKVLPCVRTYEGDLARLTLVGAVDFEQALTAAAADGGGAASEHLDAGMDAMVIETVFAGPPEDRSTVSTRLFLPARKVKEKARKLRRTFSKEMSLSTTSKNILAMTFRQVVMQQLWNFQLVVFGPGTLRDMENLESPREVTASFAISSSDERVISVLAEALCLTALQSTKEHFLANSRGRSSNSFFSWSKRPTEVCSRDSSVTVHKISEDELVENAKILVQSFKSARATSKIVNSSGRNFGWTSSTLAKLDKIGGSEFSTWLNEYVPIYRLQIDSERFEDLKLEGWKEFSENKWELALSHSQMVGLTNTLDVLYEDIYTLPGKELPCNMIVNTSSLLRAKRASSWMRMLRIALMGGILITAISIFGQTRFPSIQKLVRRLQEHRSLPSSSEDMR